MSSKTAVVTPDHAVTASDHVSVRLVEDFALLHCRSCERGERVPVQPRVAFLAGVRSFIRTHRACLLVAAGSVAPPAYPKP